MTDDSGTPAIDDESTVPANDVPKAAPADKSWLEMDTVRGEPPASPWKDAGSGGRGE